MTMLSAIASPTDAGAMPPLLGAPASPPPLAAVLLLGGVVILGFLVMRAVRTRAGDVASTDARTRIERLKLEASARQRRLGLLDRSDDAPESPGGSTAARRRHLGGSDGSVSATELSDAQRLAATLDAKAARLERLIDAADARIHGLEAHGASARPAGDAATVVPRRETAPATSPTLVDGTPTRGPFPIRGDDHRAAAPARATGQAPADPAAIEQASTAPSAAPDARDTSPGAVSRAVYELADTGHPPVDIARTLGETVGKVELILALRRGREAADEASA